MKRISLLLLLATACERTPPPPPPAPSPPALTAAPPAPAPVQPPPVTPSPPAEPEAPEPLEPEERDRDPRSETVTVKLIVTPPARGSVYWGRKKLADLLPGQMTVEAERPRDSGPLDLLIRTDGFLPHHVRVFTDRNDKLSVRMYRPDQAAGLLGYRRPIAPP